MFYNFKVFINSNVFFQLIHHDMCYSKEAGNCTKKRLIVYIIAIFQLKKKNPETPGGFFVLFCCFLTDKMVVRSVITS